MEEHFLKDFVSEVSRAIPEPWYNAAGDCIIYQISDEAIVADRIDPVLTIYRSAITGKAIGYQIKGIAAISRFCGWDGFLVECETDKDEFKRVSLSAILLAAYEQGPKTIIRRKAYADAFESCASNPRILVDDRVFISRG